jgi:AbrB family looped-hinge helix DNA binding protein
MKALVTVDHAGSIEIPMQVRSALNLEPGDALEVVSSEGEISLRPIRGTRPLTKEHGVWVFYGGEALPASATDSSLQQGREKRDAATRGKID